jgi:phage tail-like protein
MARSSANDPLEKFRFIIDWSTDSEGTALARAGFHDMQMPKRNTSKINYREGNDPDINMVSAGLSTMEDVVMSRGMIKLSDSDARDFYKWMSATHNPQPGHPGVGGTAKRSGVPADAGTYGAASYKKDVTISILHRDGSVARKFRLYNCFPTNFTPGSDLNAGEDGDKMLEQLTLAYEDFQELTTSSGSTAVPHTSST